MQAFSKVKESDLRIPFCHVGQGAGQDGWVHEKTVPYTIVAQAVSGSYEVHSKRGSVIAHEGEAFIAAANTPLRIKHRAPEQGGVMTFRYIHFQYTIYDSIDVLGLYQLPPKTDAQTSVLVGKWLHQLLALPASPNRIPDIARRQALTHQLISKLLEISTLLPDSLTRSLSEEVLPIIQYIHEHIKEPLSVETLLQRFSYSRSALFHFFKKNFNRTPMGYVKDVRLNEAYRILCGTSRPVSQIAEQCGFSNSQHFSREFRAKFNTSPTEARKLYLQ